MTSAAVAHNRSMIAWTILYVALIATISWTPFGESLLAGPLVYPVAASPAVPVIGMMWSALRYMDQVDEFVRAVFARRFILSTGITFSFCAVWGFLETFARAPHAPLWMVIPLFWATFAVLTPFVRASR